MSAETTPLAAMLRRAAMNPRQLAAEINKWLESRGLGDRRIDLTAPYSWVRQGYKPYDPIPSVAAAVLSERLGISITVDELWPGRRPHAMPALSAATGLSGYRTVDDAVGALEELSALSAGAHTEITPASGPDLTAAVHQGLSTTLQWRRQDTTRELVLQPQVDVIASHVTALRKLDDRHGGGVLSLRYITGQLRSVLDLIKAANYEPAIGHQLMTIVADLAQLVGWVHFDAGRQGAAERYLLLSEWVSWALGERGRAANAIGMLSYISAFSGHGSEAVNIASAAERNCPAVPVLQARVIGRKATACAASGDISGFRAASEKAQELLTCRAPGDRPSYLYYLEPEQLALETGQALVMLAERSTIGRKPLLREAVTLLTPLSEVGARPEYPRAALLHGAFLTKAHLLNGDLDAAVHSARASLTRLSEVQSIRGITHLKRLRPVFARRKRSEVVSSFLPEFDEALSRT
ncbi:hypothetical protein SAMN04489712_1415 [Thermomonospora echinospora]|uniref:Transcriptional regulator n=1 Tax=Thermomonospora echinospora TaxID=1992 RepID=A0A1H6E9P9_9ACTN|nr:hypothetical protein [Thermomonospora echinospora]SEG93839.1 hypothetical protein SAMN04489712_1415 [Thermomonospora echinospora]